MILDQVGISSTHKQKMEVISLPYEQKMEGEVMGGIP